MFYKTFTTKLVNNFIVVLTIPLIRLSPSLTQSCTQSRTQSHAVDEIKEEEVGDEGTADEDDQVDEVDDAVKPEEDQDEDGETIKKRGRRKALLATYEPDKRVESWVSLHTMLATDFC